MKIVHEKNIGHLVFVTSLVFVLLSCFLAVLWFNHFQINESLRERFWSTLTILIGIIAIQFVYVLMAGLLFRNTYQGKPIPIPDRSPWVVAEVRDDEVAVVLEVAESPSGYIDVLFYVDKRIGYDYGRTFWQRIFPPTAPHDYSAQDFFRNTPCPSKVRLLPGGTWERVI